MGASSSTGKQRLHKDRSATWNLAKSSRHKRRPSQSACESGFLIDNVLNHSKILTIFLKYSFQVNGAKHSENKMFHAIITNFRVNLLHVYLYGIVIVKSSILNNNTYFSLSVTIIFLLLVLTDAWWWSHRVLRFHQNDWQQFLYLSCLDSFELPG